MSGSERAFERLTVLGSLPRLIERALRIGLRRTVLGRDWDGSGCTPPRHAALAQFDLLAGGLALGAMHRVAARSAILASAERFRRSMLGRRLAELEGTFVRDAADEAFDLVVQSRHGKAYAIRFAAPRDALAAVALIAAIAPRARFVAGVVLYDLATGKSRYFASAAETLHTQPQPRAS